MMERVRVSLSEWLHDFFNQWPESVVRTSGSERHDTVDSVQLTQFFEQLSGPLKAIKYRTLNFDPWEVAGLGRKEVRNTAVLAWLLDPNETHGFGRLPLQTFLQAIRECCRSDIPENYHQYCQVQVETNPAGDNNNRVDIQINADNFFLLVEAKIDAREQEDQIARYCSDAKKRAMLRPWAVVFLTPRGHKPVTCGVGFRHEDVPCLSWRHLADMMELSLQTESKALVSANKTSPSHERAAHAAFCFLKRVRKF